MDRATIIGIVFGLGLVLWGVRSGGPFSLFWNPEAALIVFGGTAAAVTISYRMTDIIRTGSILKRAFITRQMPLPEIVQKLVELAGKVQRSGHLSLQEDLPKIRDPFMAQGIRMIVNGMSVSYIRDVLAAEILYLRDRHRIGQGIFEMAGAMAPSFGLCGTVTGMIQMLPKLKTPEEVGVHFAMAMVATFYGVVLANLIFIPLAGKLRLRSQEEVVAKEIILEGILSIAEEEHPRLVEQKLRSVLKNTVEGGSRREKLAG